MIIDAASMTYSSSLVLSFSLAAPSVMDRLIALEKLMMSCQGKDRSSVLNDVAQSRKEIQVNTLNLTLTLTLAETSVSCQMMAGVLKMICVTVLIVTCRGQSIIYTLGFVVYYP